MVLEREKGEKVDLHCDSSLLASAFQEKVRRRRVCLQCLGCANSRRRSVRLLRYSCSAVRFDCPIQKQRGSGEEEERGVLMRVVENLFVAAQIPQMWTYGVRRLRLRSLERPLQDTSSTG
jgi:hypothetical protein